jgi:hypothetical protein
MTTCSTAAAPTTAPLFAPDFNGNELASLQQQAANGDFAGLRQFLARARKACDWQDEYFVLDLIAPCIKPGSLEPICAAEPNAADLYLVRGAHLFDLISKSRGSKTADRTSGKQMAQAGEYIKTAISSLRRTTQLFPGDPTPHVFAMRCFQVFSDLHKNLHQAYQAAIQVAPDFVPAHFVMVNAQSQKWGGSDEQSLQVAHSAMSQARPGSDVAACLFLAHILVWQHAVLFDKDRKRADAYAAAGKVTQELMDGFDRWTRPPYAVRRSSVPYLHHAAYWYYQTGDRAYLQQALARTAARPWNKAWSFAGDPVKTYASALQFASNGTKSDPAQPSKKGGLFGWFK